MAKVKNFKGTASRMLSRAEEQEHQAQEIIKEPGTPGTDNSQSGLLATDNDLIKGQLEIINTDMDTIEISPKETPKGTDTHTKAPKGYKLNPQFIEKRTQRVQIVLPPSLYKKAKSKSKKYKSFNDYIISLLEQDNE